MATINIDRLEIRLKGISPHAARSSIEGLGDELIKQFAKSKGLLKAKSSINIDKIDSGDLQTLGSAGSLDLRQKIAENIAGSIESKIKCSEKFIVHD